MRSRPGSSDIPTSANTRQQSPIGEDGWCPDTRSAGEAGGGTRGVETAGVYTEQFQQRETSFANARGKLRIFAKAARLTD